MQLQACLAASSCPESSINLSMVFLCVFLVRSVEPSRLEMWARGLIRQLHPGQGPHQRRSLDPCTSCICLTLQRASVVHLANMKFPSAPGKHYITFCKPEPNLYVPMRSRVTLLHMFATSDFKVCVLTHSRPTLQAFPTICLLFSGISGHS